MLRVVQYTDDAIADLEAIAGWLVQPGSGGKARRRLMGIWAAIDRLRSQPCLYPVIDHPGVRELPCQGHRVFYTLLPDAGNNEDAGDIVVLRIYGPGQSRDGFTAPAPAGRVVTNPRDNQP